MVHTAVDAYFAQLFDVPTPLLGVLRVGTKLCPHGMAVPMGRERTVLLFPYFFGSVSFVEGHSFLTTGTSPLFLYLQLVSEHFGLACPQQTNDIRSVQMFWDTAGEPAHSRRLRGTRAHARYAQHMGW